MEDLRSPWQPCAPTSKICMINIRTGAVIARHLHDATNCWAGYFSKDQLESGKPAVLADNRESVRDWLDANTPANEAKSA
jgi:hypothetical protein